MESHNDHGVEHIPDTTFVIPILDKRTLIRFRNGIRQIAREMGFWRGIKEPVKQANLDLEYLRELATISRHMLIGNPLSRTQLICEFNMIISRSAEETPRAPCSDKAKEKSSSDCFAPTVNLTALFDILLAGKIVYRGDEKRFSQFSEAISDTFARAIALPLFYAQETAALVEADNSNPSLEHARGAIIAFVKSLAQGERVVYPLATAYRLQIDAIHDYWNEATVVDAVLDMIESHGLPVDQLSKFEVEAGESLDIILARESKLELDDLMVLLSPAYYRAKILKLRKNVVTIELPQANLNSRLLVLTKPRGKTLEKLEKASMQAHKSFPDIWGTSSLGMIPFNRWSFPDMVEDSVEITVYPPTTSLQVNLFDQKGNPAGNRPLAIGETYRVQVLPVDNCSNPNPPFKTKFDLGKARTRDKEINIVPEKAGRGTIVIKLPNVDITQGVNVLPVDPGIFDVIDDLVDQECDPDSDEACRVRGKWEPVIENALELVGVHAVLLHTGKVLFYSFDHRTVNNEGNLKKWFNNPNLGSYQIWNPSTGESEAVKPVGRNVFCAGQCQLPNGHILVAGGQDGAGAVELSEEYDKWLAAGGTLTVLIPGLDINNGSSKDLHTYDPVNDSWTRWPDMAEHRYYPTCEVLPDGKGLVVAGLSNLQRFIASGANWHQVDYFETYDLDRLNTGAVQRGRFRSADQYPIIRLLPGSRLLFTHIHNTTYLFDIDSKAWVPGAEFTPPEPVGRWTYPMQTGHVLLPQHEGEAARIFISGGSEETNFDYNSRSNARAVRRGYIFEFDSENPARSRWRETTGRPHVARLLNDHVLLPDGTVFLVNGISGGASSGHNQAPVIQCEIFDPETETFTEVATPDTNHPRGYHATALLLPDGRVAIAGHTKTYNQPVIPDDTSIQVYEPPYFCKGERPVVASPDESCDYGETVTLEAPQQAITRAMLVRPGGVTHTVDMSQRGVWLTIEHGDGNIRFTLPTDRSLAPPGYYMLFFLNEAGVPSIAHWIHLGREFYEVSSDSDCPEDYSFESPLFLGTIKDHRTVNIEHNGDIYVDKIEQHCNVRLTSRCGSIHIDEKIDQHCWVQLSARDSVRIGEKADQHCIVNIDCGGDVVFGARRGGDGKIDQHCQVNVHTRNGNLTLTRKVDANSALYARVDNGDITIRQKVDGHSVCMLYAPNGDISILEKVGGDAQVHWEANNFTCPDTSEGEIFRL